MATAWLQPGYSLATAVATAWVQHGYSMGTAVPTAWGTAWSTAPLEL